jgi:hypothetical protein
MPPLENRNDEDVIEDEPEDQIEDQGQEEQGEDPAIIAQARAQGWRPESEWDDRRAEKEGRRKPSEFVSAAEFLRRNENSLPIMRDQLRRMTEKLVQTETKITEMHSIFSEQRKMNVEAQRRAYERGKQEAKEEMRRAAEEGDVAAFDKAQEKLNILTEQGEPAPREEPAPARREPEPPAVHPDTAEWVQKNPWFSSNARLNRAMIDEHNDILRANPEMNQWDSLEQAAAMVKRRYPELFRSGQPPRRGSGSVTAPSGERSRPRGNGKSMSDLSESERASFRRQQKQLKNQGIEFTEQEFLAEYFGQ